MPDASLPSYDQLPVRDGAPAGSSWGVWGEGDVFGCLNLLTAERVVEAARLVRTGRVFALNFDAELPSPPLFGRAAPQHTVTGEPGAAGHDDVLTFNTQSSSQWDGFRHVGGPFGHYNGVYDEEHGIHHWARRGIAGRAVVADVGRWRERQGRPFAYDTADAIEPDEVRATLDDQGVEVHPGDVLLLRTGWVGWYRSLDEDARAHLAEHLAAPGLRAGEATARFLWDLHIAAIGADNPAVEVWPPGAHLTREERAEARTDPSRMIDVFVHTSLLPLLGLPLGELWDLEAVAADCAGDGVYECFFTSAPLNVRAGVASPPNALAIK
ncbi:MAG TPA: cyclase family protein [Acidimicrobiales bacterium]|nr:cyclase family protein [Acidimicrobiales bacterium]